jgi:threonine dehydrogenase-like Zn-dependent dehydrogenase
VGPITSLAGVRGAVAARPAAFPVKEGSTVALVGDGAVGLSPALASNRLGAERIISLSRDPGRQRLARKFGAADVIAARLLGAFVRRTTQVP